MGTYGREDKTEEARTKCPNLICFYERKCHVRTYLMLCLGEGEQDYIPSACSRLSWTEKQQVTSKVMLPPL